MLTQRMSSCFNPSSSSDRTDFSNIAVSVLYLAARLLSWEVLLQLLRPKLGVEQAPETKIKIKLD